MIKGVVFDKNSLKEMPVEKISFLRNFSWINIIDGSEDDLKKIQKKIDISMADLKHCYDSHEVPRVIDNKNYKFIIIKSIHEGRISTLGIIMGRRFLITMQRHDLNLKISPDELKQGTSLALISVLSAMVGRFSKQMDKIEENLTLAEDEVLDSESSHISKNMFRIKKDLLYLRKSLTANKDVISNISNEDHYSTLAVEINQLVEMESMQAARLTDILDLQQHRVSNNLNNTMKSFTVIASLLLMPMLISGIYGMNFSAIPLSHNSFGFYYALIIMIVSVVLMISYFKHKRWI